MKIYFKLLNGILLLLIMSCNNYGHDEIIKLLNSENKEDVILGAYKAGESGEKDFVPLLLKNADDVRTSINIRFKGITVYQSKMIALKKIFGKQPPIKITYKPDSTVISFYIELSKQNL